MSLHFPTILFSLVRAGAVPALALAVVFLRNPLLCGSQGLFWDPLSGLVIGLAWRGYLAGALVTALAPLILGIFSGGPQAAALLAEGGLAWILYRSRPVLGTSILTRELLIVPMAGGVTLVGAMLEQVLSMNAPFGPGFATLWIGRALGVMAVAPLALNLGRDFFIRLDRRLFLGWLLLTLLLVGVARVAANPDLEAREGLALALLPIVILFWQAMRFGVPGTSLGCFLVALLAGLGWAEGNPGLLSFPPGVLALILTAVLGTAHGMAALRDEWEEIRSWTDAAARRQKLVFWRWRRGSGIEWDRPEAAPQIGLRGGGQEWQTQPHWQGPVVWPEPSGLAQAAVVELRDPHGTCRKVELAGKVEARDTEGRPSLVLGVALDVTAREQAREERERLLRREAELRALKSQLHPHVIFNALNRIASLTMADPERARDLLVRLSRLLRAALLAGEKPGTSLAEEMSLIRDYLQLEGAGYGGAAAFPGSHPCRRGGSQRHAFVIPFFAGGRGGAAGGRHAEGGSHHHPEPARGADSADRRRSRSAGWGFRISRLAGPRLGGAPCLGRTSAGGNRGGTSGGWCHRRSGA